MFHRYKSSAVSLTLGNTDTDNAYYHTACYVFVGVEKPCQHPSDRVQKDMSCTPPEHALEPVFPNPEKSYHCPLATRICRCIWIRTKPHAHKYTQRRKHTHTHTHNSQDLVFMDVVAFTCHLQKCMDILVFFLFREFGCV